MVSVARVWAAAGPRRQFRASEPAAGTPPNVGPLPRSSAPLPLQRLSAAPPPPPPPRPLAPVGALSAFPPLESLPPFTAVPPPPEPATPTCSSRIAWQRAINAPSSSHAPRR